VICLLSSHIWGPLTGPRGEGGPFHFGGTRFNACDLAAHFRLGQSRPLSGRPLLAQSGRVK